MSDDVSEKLKPLRGEIAALERELKAMREIKRAIVSWKIEKKGCRAIPFYADGSPGPALDLRPLLPINNAPTISNATGSHTRAFAGTSAKRAKRYRKCRTSLMTCTLPSEILRSTFTGLRPATCDRQRSVNVSRSLSDSRNCSECWPECRYHRHLIDHAVQHAALVFQVEIAAFGERRRCDRKQTAIDRMS